jgi:hypothetical protein
MFVCGCLIGLGCDEIGVISERSCKDLLYILVGYCLPTTQVLSPESVTRRAHTVFVSARLVHDLLEQVHLTLYEAMQWPFVAVSSSSMGLYQRMRRYISRLGLKPDPGCLLEAREVRSRMLALQYAPHNTFGHERRSDANSSLEWRL